MVNPATRTTRDLTGDTKAQLNIADQGRANRGAKLQEGLRQFEEAEAETAAYGAASANLKSTDAFWNMINKGLKSVVDMSKQ